MQQQDCIEQVNKSFKSIVHMKDNQDSNFINQCKLDNLQSECNDEEDDCQDIDECL